VRGVLKNPVRTLSDVLSVLNREILPVLDSVRRQAVPKQRTVTSSLTLDQLDSVVIVDATSGPVTVTLLAISKNPRRICVKKWDATANAVTVVGGGGELIDGSASAVLSAQYDAIDLEPLEDQGEWGIF